MSAPSYDYEVIVHPIDMADGSAVPSRSVGRFSSDKDIREAGRQVTGIVISTDPPVDLDDRIEVKNNNPAWPNKYQETAENWIPGNLHSNHPRDILNR